MSTTHLLAACLLIAMSGTLVLALRHMWGRRQPGPEQARQWDITFIVAIGHVVVFLVVPAVLRLVTNWRADRSVLVAPEEIVLVYAIELVSFVVWGLVVVLTTPARRPGSPSTPSDPAAPADATTRYFVMAIMTVGAIIAIERIINRSTLDSTRFGTSEATTLTERYLWPLTPMAFASGTVVGSYVLVRGRRVFGGAAWAMAAGALALYLVTAGLTGVRGALLWPAVWTLLLVWLYDTTQRGRQRALLLLGIIFTLSLQQSSVVALRDSAKDATVGERMEKLAATSGNEDLLDLAEFRLGCASRYSVGFLRMWDAGESAGWRPILNSLYAPIPRAFMPDKPVPTSRDGDAYSMGMYLIVSEIHHHQQFSMSEFVTGSHAYWELGWPGVILLSAFAGLYSRFAIWFASRFGGAGPAVLLYFFKPWGYNNPKLWASDIILEIVQLVPCALVFWYIARVLARVSRLRSAAA